MSADQRRITLTENEDGWWTAHDDTAGLTAEAETRDEALAALDDVIEAVEGDGGHEPTDDELRELGIDPDENHHGGDLPEVLR